MSRRLALLVILGFMTLIISASLSGFAASNTVPQSRVADITATPPTPVPTITSTPTNTATNAPTGTPTRTPTPVPPCTVTIPQLNAGFGYYYSFTPTAAGTITLSWTIPSNRSGSISLYDVNSSNPFSGQPNPWNHQPPTSPAPVATAGPASNTINLSFTSGTTHQYVAYFYNAGGNTIPSGNNGTATFQHTTCPP